MRKSFLSLFILTIYTHVFPAASIRVITPAVPLYELAIISCNAGRDISNPFISINLKADITAPDGRTFRAEGFYDGGQEWRLRFMPDRTGTWTFAWQFGAESGTGSFSCVSKQNSKLHGHIRVDPANPHKLRFDDGTPLHWIGGKYIDFDDPFYRTPEHASVPERLPTSQYMPLVHTYLQNIAAMGLNGIVLKLRVMPINYDLVSMDLDYLDNADQIMQWCMDLGINVQLNFFDTWGKRKQGADISISNPDPADLLLEPHNPDSYRAETEFFIRYLIARYAAWPNLMWELWNEAERQKVAAKDASVLYAGYFDKYDPYDLPISASEIQTATYPLQITSMHAGFKCDPSEWNWTHDRTANPALYSKWKAYGSYGYGFGRPILWNELYPYDGSDDGGGYATNTAAHDWFRATFWGNFTAGSVGTSEFCWAPIDEVPNKVTEYHSHFAAFLSHLRDLNALEPADAEAETSSGKVTMCRKPGKEYVVYHFTQTRNSQSRLNLKLPAGNYYYQFYDPKNGSTVGERAIHHQAASGWQSFETPTFHQDLVLYLIESSYYGIATPVELAHFSARRSRSGVELNWRTESESSNWGFQIDRAALENGPYTPLTFITGHGTTPAAHDYHCTDPAPLPGRSWYRLTQIDADGTSHPYPAISVAAAAPLPLRIQAYPNPVRHQMTLRFHLDRPDRVRCTIYNTLQQTVWQGSWQECEAGEQELRWDGNDYTGRRVASGLYFYRFEFATEQPPDAKNVGRFIYAP